MKPSRRSSRPLRLAAIDIGTNSIHLIVADIDRRTGKFRILDREKEKLGSSRQDAKMPEPEETERPRERQPKPRELDQRERTDESDPGHS